MSGPINDGGPAFPQPMSDVSFDQWASGGAAGMSLRDWFAGQALSGLLGSEANALLATSRRAAAREAYALADAMLAERAKGGGA